MKKRSTIVLRVAQSADAPALSRLVRRNADAVLAADYTSQQLAAWKRYNTPGLWRRHIARRWCVIAECAGRICGTIGLEQDELVGFYVSPTRRGEGIGKRLLTKLERAAAKKGLCKLWLTSSPSAEGFYLAHGWKKRRSVTLRILGVDFIELHMVKTLPAPT